MVAVLCLRMAQVPICLFFSSSLFFCVFICIPAGWSPAGRCRAFPREAPAPATLTPLIAVGKTLENFCAFHVAFDSCLLAPQGHGSLNANLLKNKQICTLVLVDELQAGLADGDIYLSVYLKRSGLKVLALDLFICVPSACVCVRVCACVC